MLCEDTKVDLADVPLYDEQVISLFKSPEALNVTPQQILCETCTCNIPDFSSATVQRICLELAPSSVEELIRISGYAHGTDVWKGNAQEYIRAGIATCMDCPSLRDDIFNDLCRAGMPKEDAYSIIWSVWRGRGLTPEMAEAMRKAGFPEWYLESCRKMKYMFPRAHAAAYVVANLQLAWFKLYHPESFYAVYLTRYQDYLEETDIQLDTVHLRKAILSLRSTLAECIPDEDGYFTYDKECRLSVLETLLEMRCRGIEYDSLWSS